MSANPGALPNLSATQPKQTVELVGEALETVEELMAEMPGEASHQDVVYRGIALLRAARGKRVELRVPGSKSVEVIDVWG